MPVFHPIRADAVEHTAGVFFRIIPDMEHLVSHILQGALQAVCLEEGTEIVQIVNGNDSDIHIVIRHLFSGQCLRMIRLRIPSR